MSLDTILNDASIKVGDMLAKIDKLEAAFEKAKHQRDAFKSGLKDEIQMRLDFNGKGCPPMHSCEPGDVNFDNCLACWLKHYVIKGHGDLG